MWYLYNGGINFSAFYWESFVISDHRIHFDEKLLDQTKSCSNQDIATAVAVKSDCAHCIFVYILSNEWYKKVKIKRNTLSIEISNEIEKKNVYKYLQVCI